MNKKRKAETTIPLAEKIINVPYDLIPFVSVGCFKFGDEIQKHLPNFDFSVMNDEQEGDYTYKIEKDEILLMTEFGKIFSIGIYQHLFYNGVNILGMMLHEFMDKFQAKYVGGIDHIEINDHLQEVYEFEDLGLQIWVQEGIIVTVFASGVIEED